MPGLRRPSPASDTRNPMSARSPIRRRLSLLAAATLLLAGALVWFWRVPMVGAPTIPASACQRLPLVDASTGKPIVGAEDLAYDPARRRVLVSAYDRLAAERGDPPGGGLYALPEATLGSATRLPPILLEKGVAPHGIDIADGKLAVVERRYAGDAPPQVSIGLYDLQANRLAAVVRDTRLCRANDLVLLPGPALEVTLDRGPCTQGKPSGDGRVAEIVWPDGPGARVDILEDDLRFPNGIAAVGSDIVVADTRAQALRMLGSTARRVLPGGPDNITRDSAGRLVVALHPSLLRFGLHRYGWPLGDHAPSRILRTDFRTGASELLFDDPDGTTWSGATVGLVIGSALLLGSVREQGLLVCPMPGGAA